MFISSLLRNIQPGIIYRMDVCLPGWLNIFRSLLLLPVVLFISCNSSHPKLPFVLVEDFRSSGMSDDAVIQAALNSAGTGSPVYFEPSRVYTIFNTIEVKRFQRLIGNNATLRRAPQSYTTLEQPAEASSSILVLHSVPEEWKEGDQIQVFTDSTGAHSNEYGDYPVLPNKIISIKGNTIKLSSEVGHSGDGSIVKWPQGAIVRKVFTLLRGESINIKSAPFTVENLNFDGNKKDNNLNYYWNVNSTIFIRGMGGKIADCRFYNISNENIVGHGMYVENCQATGLNGSFVHFSGIDTLKEYPQRNAIITGNTVNGVCLISTGITGHSEAVFTTSYNGGYATVTNNRIYNSGGAVIGIINSPSTSADGGKSEFMFTGNLFKNCKSIIHDIVVVEQGPTDIYIADNIFSGCGENDWSKISSKYTGLVFGQNSLTHNTTWKYHAQPDSTSMGK